MASASGSTDLSTYKLIHSMIRVKDPARSIKFYRSLGCTLVKKLAITEKDMKLYYLAYDGPGSLHHGCHWTNRSGVLELTPMRGSEKNDNFSVTNGNTEPHLGFGHIAISVDNLNVVRQKLNEGAFQFVKQLTETEPLDAVFIIDPDGYWVRLIERCGSHQEANIVADTTSPASYRLSHTMLRIKDPSISLPFYQKVLGMTLLRTSPPAQTSSDCTSYFLGFVSPSSQLQLPLSSTADMEGILELVWKHGTEKQKGEVYHDGNSPPEGFGHLCISVDDLDAACARFEKFKPQWAKKQRDGSDDFLAFMLDPDGYWVEILQNEAIKPRMHW